MIRHVSSIAEVVEDVEAAVAFYEGLGLAVKREGDEYAIVEIPGILHFGIWSRAAAAESTFGDRSAAGRIPLGISLGFEVDDVDAAAASLGTEPLRAPTLEPWGQKTSRFSTPSGALAEFSATPWARELASDVRGREGEI